MKTALLISYYWPPSGGAGVHRWLKMSRYLGEHGWRLIVYTPSNAAFPVEDESLLKIVPPEIEIIRQPIWEPYGWYRFITGRKPKEAVYSGFISEKGVRSLRERLSIWIRGNLFLPDPRKFWIRPSVRYLNRFISNSPVDAIISTGPPHSMHLIALGLVKRTPVPWIADFRDPWTGIDYYEEMMLSGWADRRHHAMEKQVLQTASSVVTVSPSWARQLEQLEGRGVEVITNGFDPSDFVSPAPDLDKAFTICHLGSMNQSRNPLALWRALAKLLSEGHPMMNQLRVELVGPVDHGVLRSVEELGLGAFVSCTEYVPHETVIARMRSSQVLLLPVNDTRHSSGVVPGKLFEYLGARRPILLIGPPGGDAAAIVRSTESGGVADFGDSEAVIEILTNFYKAFVSGDLNPSYKEHQNFSRRSLAGEYAKLLDRIRRA